MAETVFIWGEEEKFVNYANALRSCGATPVFSKDIDRSDDCGALLLPGGGDIHPKYYGADMVDCRGLDEERDAAEWELMTRFTKTGRPILGVCRGMQVLNVFFGGTCVSMWRDTAAQMVSMPSMRRVRQTVRFSPAGGETISLSTATTIRRWRSWHPAFVPCRKARMVWWKRSPMARCLFSVSNGIPSGRWVREEILALWTVR